jgi:hypothetical protein
MNGEKSVLMKKWSHNFHLIQNICPAGRIKINLGNARYTGYAKL